MATDWSEDRKRNFIDFERSANVIFGESGGHQLVKDALFWNQCVGRQRDVDNGH